MRITRQSLIEIKEDLISSMIIVMILAVAILIRPLSGHATSDGTFSSVETGSGTVTGNGSQNYLEFCDTFTAPYASAPRVFLSPEEVTGGQITQAAPPTSEVYSNGTSGFCARLGSRDNSNWPNGFQVRVNWVAVGALDAAPTVTVPNGTLSQGGTYAGSGSLSDSDSSSWTATVNYGDGSGNQSLSLSGTSFSLSHTYASPGTYTVTVSVTDNQGKTGVGTAKAMVVSYYNINDGTNFKRSTSAYSSGVATQTINSDGTVTVSINSAPGYADSGFDIYEGTIGNLPNFTVNGTGNEYSLNIWFDTNNNSEFFAWDTNGILTGLDSDTYALGPASSSGTDAITGSSQFYLMSDGQNHSLSDLRNGSVSGVSSSTKVAVWVGVNVSSGSTSATIQPISGL